MCPPTIVCCCSHDPHGHCTPCLVLLPVMGWWFTTPICEVDSVCPHTVCLMEREGLGSTKSCSLLHETAACYLNHRAHRPLTRPYQCARPYSAGYVPTLVTHTHTHWLSVPPLCALATSLTVLVSSAAPPPPTLCRASALPSNCLVPTILATSRNMREQS